MIKCFWCGTPNPRGETVCAECKRELQWSRFLRAILSPGGCSRPKSAVQPMDQLRLESFVLSEEAPVSGLAGITINR